MLDEHNSPSLRRPCQCRHVSLSNPVIQLSYSRPGLINASRMTCSGDVTAAAAAAAAAARHLAAADLAGIKHGRRIRPAFDASPQISFNFST